jgi:hypothetical protein
VLKIDTLVIGSSLKSLQFADKTGATILINGSEIPHKIENFKEWEEWHRLTFMLGMRGLTPLSSNIEKIRIEDTITKIVTESSRVIKIQFEKLYIFGMERIEGIPVKERVSKYIVYDWFNIKRGAKQVIEKISAPGDFVTKLCFYPSERRDGNDGSFKDCYTKSYISSENIEKFEYSETASKFAAMKLIKEKALKGPSRQFGEKIHHLNLILEHSRRDLHKYEKEFIINERLPNNIFLL